MFPTGVQIKCGVKQRGRSANAEVAIFCTYPVKVCSSLHLALRFYLRWQ